MRAVLGLSLIFGGSVLALYLLSGRVPFSGGSASGAAPRIVESSPGAHAGNRPVRSGGGLP